MQSHVFIDTDIVDFPLTILAFLVLRRQPVNLSCLSTLWSRRLSKRLRSIQASINSWPTGNSGFSCFKMSANKSLKLMIESQAFQTTETYPYHACVHGMVDFPTHNKQASLCQHLQAPISTSKIQFQF